jgi:ferredoxin
LRYGGLTRDAAERETMADESTPANTVRVTVRHDGEETVLTTTPGRNLRALLLDAGLSPYTRLTSRANCGGRGICATCGVRIRAGAEPPTHWHDRLADRFGYPRLSCQVTVDDDMTVDLPEKVVWGGRE